MSWVYPDHKPHQFDGKLFYLPLIFSEEEGEDHFRTLHGLVLKLSTPETYIGIGSFEVVDVEYIELFLSGLCDRPVTMQELRSNDLLSSKEGDGKTWQMVTIV